MHIYINTGVVRTTCGRKIGSLRFGCLTIWKAGTEGAEFHLIILGKAPNIRVVAVLRTLTENKIYLVHHVIPTCLSRFESRYESAHEVDISS